MPATASGRVIHGSSPARSRGAAHSIDEQERLAVGSLLLQSLDTGSNRASPAKEEVRVFEFENVETAEWRPDLFLRSERHPIGVHRPGDVLHLVLAEVDKFERQPIAGMSVDGLRNAYPTRV